MYPKELTAPMAQELEIKGFQSLTNSSQVDQALDNAKGTTLLMVNSVCGCAAAAARPGILLSLENDKNPSQLVTVFAGVDTEAVQKAREYLLPYPPSSPCIALLKDGKIVHFLERHHIEGRSAQMIADNLRQAYNVFC
jgi:putative YphP/YqiW family bacilliredoxin